jgi:hypothetical protein
MPLTAALSKASPTARSAARPEQAVLIAQSYMPAQDIHVLVNPQAAGGSPWYRPAPDGALRPPNGTSPVRHHRPTNVRAQERQRPAAVVLEGRHEASADLELAGWQNQGGGDEQQNSRRVIPRPRIIDNTTVIQRNASTAIHRPEGRLHRKPPTAANTDKPPSSPDFENRVQACVTERLSGIRPWRRLASVCTRWQPRSGAAPTRRVPTPVPTRSTLPTQIGVYFIYAPTRPEASKSLDRIQQRAQEAERELIPVLTATLVAG